MSKHGMGPRVTLTTYYMDGTTAFDVLDAVRPAHHLAREASRSPHCLRAIVWSNGDPGEQKVFAGGRMKTEMLSRTERTARLERRGLPAPKEGS